MARMKKKTGKGAARVAQSARATRGKTRVWCVMDGETTYVQHEDANEPAPEKTEHISSALSNTRALMDVAAW